MTRIGLAISTRNRHGIYEPNYERWRTMMPDDSVLVVVDDASNPPAKNATFRFDQNVGIAPTKNKCIELLLEAGCEHLFLADDDCYPIDPNWYEPYVNNPEPHLMAIYEKQDSAIFKELGRDDKTIWFNFTRGYFLYFTRECIERVGMFDTDFTDIPRGIAGMYEHTNLSDRIYAAGLTTHKYQDVLDSDALIYSQDHANEVESTFTDEDRKLATLRNRRLKIIKRNSFSSGP